MRARIWFLTAILAGASISAFQETRLPATLHLTAYLEAFNSGNPASMREFIQAHFADSALRQTPLEERVSRHTTAASRWQSLNLQKIVAERPGQTLALVRTGKGEYLLLRAGVEKEPPHRLLFIYVEPVQDPQNVIVPEPKANDEELMAAARQLLEAETRADEFSGVVLIAKNFQVLFQQAYGFADREKKIPNQKDTKFNLGSINKNFTRAAILQLKKQGKLSLPDPIQKFLPDYPNRQAAEKVTIQQLLDMTSGIGDFFGPRYEATPKENIRSLQDYLPLFADQPLEFEPGTNNRYSNGGYIVLGAIIEKASGLDYYTYVRENIFKPTGMLATDSYERDKAVPNLALGYTRRGRPGGERVLNQATLPGRGSSAGGGYSTAEDLLKYVQALSLGKIFLPDIANGLGIAGGAPGINANLEWDRRSGYVVIVLTNFDPPTAGRASRQIMSWLPES
jgi:CubicO group peptidase (beta-lactamase class C family)